MAEAEAVLVKALDDHFAARVVTETPADLAGQVPLIRVTRFGGSDDDVYTFDNASMDFDCYESTRAAARTLAYDVREFLRSQLEGQTITTTDGDKAFVARVRSISGPNWTPYDNTNLRRFTYSAQIRLHTI